MLDWPHVRDVSLPSTHPEAIGDAARDTWLLQMYSNPFLPEKSLRGIIYLLLGQPYIKEKSVADACILV